MATPAPAAAPAPAASPQSAPAPAAPAAADGSTVSTETAVAAVAGVAIFYWVALAIFLILFHLGAAKLSYDLHQSALWGILSFLFASVYYPYYAFVYSTRRESSSFLGGRKHR